MSIHHERQKWSSKTPHLRAQLTSLMQASGGALPCVDCGQPVRLGVHKWQVGHKVPASKGGKPTLANVGPSHCKTFDQLGRTVWPRNCNQVAGGKLGASVTNSRRHTSKDIRPWP